MDTLSPQKGHDPLGYEEIQSSVYAFVGNPNCGKTTIFNHLTGLRQKVGNYPGVTVEKKIGEFFSQHGKPLKIIDLPGSYSLAARSPDEAILRDVLYGRRVDTPRPGRVVCIVDASNLERNLYLVHQVFDLGLPTILVLNMMDIAAQSGLTIDVAGLEKKLGIPVIPCEANSGKGLLELRLAMSRSDIPCPSHEWVLPEKVEEALGDISAKLLAGGRHSERVSRAESLLLLTEQESVRLQGSGHTVPEAMEAVLTWEFGWKRDAYDWRGAIVAARYDNITEICQEVVDRQQLDHLSMSDRIDAVTLHPIFGWLILGGIMSALFMSIFTLANYPMDLIDGLVSSFAGWVKGVMPAGDLQGLVTDGIIAGVGGVLIFLPQILILFFFIGLLESTGYMARAAFIMDRL
ncbi:MAG: ferrous iron transporter B, partial [Opitutaceae bacterium]|nr:ferrous iron transporter B [Opitutaceae bacterium]